MGGTADLGEKMRLASQELLMTEFPPFGSGLNKHEDRDRWGQHIIYLKAS